MTNFRRSPALFLAVSGIAIALHAKDVRAAAPDPNARFVAADVVKLRKIPAGNGEVLANLRINTLVGLAGGNAPAGWVRVRTRSKPPLTGFVAASFLSRTKQDSTMLSASIDRQRAAGDLGGAIAMAERLMALTPDDRKHVERLRSLYQRKGDTAAVERLTASLDGQDAKFIVTCVGKGKKWRSVLLASYRPSEGIVPLVGAKPDRLTKLKLSLQRSPWSMLDLINVQTSRTIPGTGMLWAYVVTGSKRARAGLAETTKLVFSKGCANTDLIFSTEPTNGVKSGMADWPKVAAMVEKLRRRNGLGDHLYWIRAQRILDGAPLISIEMGPVDWQSRGAYAIPYKKSVTSFAWALLDETSGRLLQSAGNYGRPDSNVTVSRITWFKWRSARERVAIVDFSENHDSGGAGDRVRVVVIDGKNTVHHKTMALNHQIGD